jgi:fucose 4-O-acetylase-like acetyltransferase
MMVTVAAGYLWERRPTAGTRWSPLQLLGQHSLFVYWIHVEMVYGLPSTPIHRSLSLAQAWAALGLFCLFILLLVVAKGRLVRWWRAGKPLQMSPRGDAGSAIS